MQDAAPFALHEHCPLGKTPVGHRALVHNRRSQIEKADIFASDPGGHLLEYWINLSTPTTWGRIRNSLAVNTYPNGMKHK